METEGISARNIVLDDESTEEELLHLWETLNEDQKPVSKGRSLAAKILDAAQRAHCKSMAQIVDLCRYIMALTDEAAEEANDLLMFVRCKQALSPTGVNILEADELLVEFSHYLTGQHIRRGLATQ